MIIDSIQNGIVIDHISAGKAMELYRILGLDKLDCTVAPCLCNDLRLQLMELRIQNFVLDAFSAQHIA